MNKTILIIAVITALTIVLSIYLWTSNNRYYTVTNKKGLVYEIDKKTGKTWLITGVNKRTTREIVIKKLDSDSLSLLKGSATRNKENEIIWIELYNGSKWTLDKMVILISAKENVMGDTNSEPNTGEESNYNQFAGILSKNVPKAIGWENIPDVREQPQINSPLNKNLLEDNPSNWSRSYALDIHIKPLSSDRIRFEALGTKSLDEYSWYIIEAFGYIEQY